MSEEIPNCIYCGGSDFDILKVNFGPPIKFPHGPTAAAGGGDEGSIGDYLLSICRKCSMTSFKKPSYWKL